MKSRLLLFLICLLLIIWAIACTSEQSAEAESKGNPLTALAQKDAVTVGPPDNMQALLASKMAKLYEGYQVTVDEEGHAVIALSDNYVVELLRDGNLELQKAELDEDSLLLAFAQNGGISLNSFNPDKAIESRLQITSDYLVVTATGTMFLVMEEENTPLKWVVALPDPDSRLHVTANNTTAPVPAGQAVWIAPIGPPGPVFEAKMSEVITWIENLRNTGTVPALGEVVWNPANIEVPIGELPDSISVSDTVVLNGVGFEFDPQGFYEKTDCNGDGLQDLHVQNGRVQLDFRQVIGQVRNISVTLVNHQPDTPLNLTGFNPADVIISEAQMTTTQGNNTQALILYSPAQPFHYADLEISEACLAEIKLIPPDETPETTPEPPIPTSPTNTATPTPTSNACSVEPPDGWVQYAVQTGDTLFNLSNRTSTSIDAIMSTNCLQDTVIHIGQILWLPFIPPTITPATVVPRPCQVAAKIADPTYLVNVSATNLNDDTNYNVFINGSNVGELNASDGNQASDQFFIPEADRNSLQLTVGLTMSANEGVLCTTTIDNIPYTPCVNYIAGTGGIVPTPPGTTAQVIPSISVSNVVPDQSVTIQTYNFPANLNFTACMHYMGTQGVGGTNVGSLNSGAGGSFRVTFPIPDYLKGEEQIAIRLENAQGFYAYTWFWNKLNVTNIPLGDADFDNLSDDEEINIYKTDPDNQDTDGDNIIDGDEVNIYQTNPLASDSDEDTLSDDNELFEYGTNPNAADTDGDGYSDGEEVYPLFSDPLDPYDPGYPDADGDGLSDQNEDEFGTDPENPDTDGDQLKDGEEVNVYMTDPLSIDTDSDTIQDGIEVFEFKTNPNADDTDADEISDPNELFELGTDPNAADTDGDGYSDGEEIYNIGSDPLDPLDPDGVTQVSPLEHIVQSGETLYGISLKYGIAWQDIAEFNHLTTPYVPYVGQSLLIPQN